ncbi:MAG: hypothetical protein ACPGR2_14640 [Psychrobium sp.]
MKYAILLLISFPALANITFVNVTPNTQKQLIAAIDKGVPVFYSDFDTGEKSPLKSNSISKITQHSNIFSVCTNPSSLYKIKFKCFKQAPCRFITDGSVSKARTVHDECVISE